MEETNELPASDKPVEQLVTGYQWGADMSYIGTYEFPDNRNEETVHLPPKTTLKPPPTGLPPGKEAAFDGALGDWIVRDEDLSWMDEATRTAYLAMAEQAVP